MASILQPSFSSGEITPSAFGRLDLAKYATGAKTVRNFITKVHGGLANRPGTEFIAEVKDSTKTGDLLPFVFTAAQSYVLVMGDQSMQVVKDGGLVLEANKTITGTTNAAPVVVTSNAHGYSNGDRVFISGTGIVALDNRFWIVAGVAANTFQLSGSAAPGSTSATGTAARVFNLSTPYTESQLLALRFTQLNDVMTLVNGAAGVNGIRPKDLSRTDHAAWALTDMVYEEGPFQDVNTNQEKTMLIDRGTGTGITLSATGHTPFLASHVGMLIYLEQKDRGVPWEVGKTVAAGDIRRSEGKYYKALNAGTTGTLRPQNDTHDSEYDGAINWHHEHSGYGVGIITGYTSNVQVTIEALITFPGGVIGGTKVITGTANSAPNIGINCVAHGFSVGDTIYISGIVGTTEANGVWVVDAVTTDTFNIRDTNYVNAYVSGGIASKGATHKWAFGAWGGDQGWPAAITYFQQRRALAATPTQPVKSWFTGTNSFKFYGKSTPIVDSDAFNMLLASNRSDPIQHMVTIGKLIVLTSANASQVRPRSIGGGQWTIPDDDNNPVLSPSKLSARSQEAESIIYNTDKGQTVYDLAYQFQSNNFGGKDLSVLSKHLFEKHNIVSAAYQHVPFQVDWEVRDDGTLLGMTYLKEHEVWGWHRHDTLHGYFERVATISEGTEHRVYFLVKRVLPNGTTKRYIERLSSRLFTDIKDAKFLDSSLTYDGRNTSATTMTISGGVSWNYAIDQFFTLTASAAHFVAADVGSEIHMKSADGRVLRLEITGYTSTTVVTVKASRNIPVEFRTVATAAWGHARKVFRNIDHLEGETVGIYADAYVHPQKVVAAGVVTLDYCAVVVCIGLPIQADLETLSLNGASAGGLLDKEKAIPAVRVLVEESVGISAGADATDLISFDQRLNENYDDPITPLSGMASIHIPCTWSQDGRVFIRQSDPVPLSILAVIPEFQVGGSR